MKKLVSIAAVAALVLGIAAPAFAQSAQTTQAPVTAQTTGTATAIIMAGAAGAASGGPAGGAAAAAAAAGSSLANPQWVMGQSTPAPGMVTYDACQLSRSGAISMISAGWTQTIDECYAQRQAQFAKDGGEGAMAYELMCSAPRWAAADIATGKYACSQNRAKSPTYQQAMQAPVAVAPAPVVMASFDPSIYRTGSDCLNHAPAGQFALCAGKP